MVTVIDAILSLEMDFMVSLDAISYLQLLCYLEKSFMISRKSSLRIILSSKSLANPLPVMASNGLDAKFGEAHRSHSWMTSSESVLMS